MDWSQSLDGKGSAPDTSGEPLPPVPGKAAAAGTHARRRRKANHARQFWMKQLHSWHWISAALSLIGMFLFAITGITLNHASSIGAEPSVVERTAALPRPLLAVLNQETASSAPLPEAVSRELGNLVQLDPGRRLAEWSDQEVYVALPGPGSDAWISIDRATGAVAAEHTDRGWISYLNDLHKGRNTGTAWFWFIDVFAIACIVFTVTGLLLLQVHSKRRPSTWPLVMAGAAVPVVIAMFLIHS